MWKGNGLASTVMRMWCSRRQRLIHDYSLVGYILAPNPVIMSHAIKHKKFAHEEAAERLIVKLLLNPILVGNMRENEKARLIDKFHEEFGDFTGRRGRFNRVHIWITAADPSQQAFRWHQKYSLQSTEVLGRLACLVTSKILGIGTAERNWKQIKAVKTGQRANTGVEKCKKQVMIYSQYQAMRGQLRTTRLSCAGKLWDDDDFQTMKMDEFCKEISDGLQVDKAIRTGKIRIFKAWRERWEIVKLGPNGDIVLEARLLRKYGGIKWFDPDSEQVFTSHTTKMHFEKKRGDNQYNVFGILQGYDMDLADDHPDNIDQSEPWSLSLDWYEQVALYYKESSADVVCYDKEFGVCESDDE